MKNVVITGATGLLGSHLLPLLEDDGCRVWAISSLPTEKDTDRLTWVQCDLAGDLAGLQARLPERIDAVIHLAQSPRFRDFPGGAMHVFNVNVQATMHLLDVAWEAGCGHFINASSGGIYANPESPVREDDAGLLSAGSGFYPVSKQCGELLVNGYAGLMHAVNLRFFFIYGRGQAQSMLIPRLADSVDQGRAISLQGRDGLRINPIHASDAAVAVMRCLEMKGARTINIAGNEVVSLREIGRIIGRKLNREPVFSCTKETESSPEMVADTSLMHRLLGVPSVHIKEGLADYCASLSR